ncbi:hypothetical protein F8155_22650 [Priestia endophytica]|nr:hypothetical protein F8155_22650 [Priestia endophytica]
MYEISCGYSDKGRLEPCEGKLSSTVLRGVGGSDAPCLLDLTRSVCFIHKKRNSLFRAVS